MLWCGTVQVVLVEVLAVVVAEQLVAGLFMQHETLD